jgi:heme exporter protein CcmD
MQKLTDVLAMGGYGVYIWPSFLVAALVMGVLAVSSLRSFKRARQTLLHLQDTHEA